MLAALHEQATWCFCFEGSNQLDTVLSQAFNPQVRVSRPEEQNDRNKSMSDAYISKTIITNKLTTNHTYIQDTFSLPLQRYCSGLDNTSSAPDKLHHCMTLMLDHDSPKHLCC